MKKRIADIICNAFNQDKTLEEQAAYLGELVWERDNLLRSNTRRMTELERMIEIQSRLVMRMLNNGDEEEYQPPKPRKPHLRIVK